MNKCSSAVITFFSAYGFALGVPFVGSKFFTRSLGTGSSVTVPTGWQKNAIEYLGSVLDSPSIPFVPPLGKITLWTVLRKSPLVQYDSRSPMLTRIGGLGSPSVPGGLTGTGAQLPSFVTISRPAWPRSLKRSVIEP